MQAFRQYQMRQLSSALLPLYYVLVIVLSSTASLAVNDYSQKIQERRIMNERITRFINSLDLPLPQAQYLTLKLGHDSTLEVFLNGKEHDASALLQLACLSAEIGLGADSVDTTPVDHTEVESNWFVFCLPKI